MPAVFFGVDPRFSVARRAREHPSPRRDLLQGPDHADQGRPRSARLVEPRHPGAGRRDARAPADRVRDDDVSLRRAGLSARRRAVLEAIDAASQIVVVANQELPTLRSASRIASHLRQRCGPDRVKVAITRFDPKADISRRPISRACSAAPVNYVFPNDYQTSVAALTRGEPLIVQQSQPAGQVVRRVRARARRAGSRSRRNAAKGGLFGRLGGRR